jgi:DNA-directed RNA polymerase specialized sigma24 family protein
MSKGKKICRPKDKVKDEILRGYEYQLEIADSLERELEKRMAKATKTTSIISDMPRGGESLDAGDHIADWEPLQKQIRAEIEGCVWERIRIKAFLDTVKIPKLRTILQLTYIECLDVDEIAIRMDYCSRQIQRLQDQALEHVKI